MPGDVVSSHKLLVDNTQTLNSWWLRATFSLILDNDGQRSFSRSSSNAAGIIGRRCMVPPPGSNSILNRLGKGTENTRIAGLTSISMDHYDSDGTQRAYRAISRHRKSVNNFIVVEENDTFNESRFNL